MVGNVKLSTNTSPFCIHGGFKDIEFFKMRCTSN